LPNVDEIDENGQFIPKYQSKKRRIIEESEDKNIQENVEDVNDCEEEIKKSMIMVL